MDLCDYLREHRVHFEVVLHRPAPCASRRASCLHVPGRGVAKGVLLRVGETYLLAVLPATHRIDLVRLEEVLGVNGLVLATESEIGAIFTDCEFGAIPAFGRRYGLTTIVDSSLAGASEIVIDGNLRHQGVRMRYRDYEAVEAPIRARFAVFPETHRGAGRRRRAG